MNSCQIIEDIHHNRDDYHCTDTTDTSSTVNYHDINWAKEFELLDNKLDSMDMSIIELINYEIKTDTL